VANVDLSDVYYKQIEILGSRMGTAIEFSKVLTAISLPELRPAVGNVLSIREARAAHEAMEKRTFVGKMVLKHDW
jgi:D-arabinose 1-dehydrogenase-like Zn-dependent alcohol dehydrogenase